MDTFIRNSPRGRDVRVLVKMETACTVPEKGVFQNVGSDRLEIESEKTCRPGSCDLIIIGKYPTRLISQVNDIYEVHGKSSCIAMALSDVVEILTNCNSVPKLRQVLPTEKPRGNPTVIPKVS